MIKPVLHTIILLFIVVSLKAQENLVLNGSFEEYYSCPVSNDLNNGQLELAKGWWKPTAGTSDYFNRCNTGVVGVPDNFWGYQEAYDGDGYIGLVPIGWYKENMQITALEYIQTKLTQSLIPCGNYHFSMYVSCADYSQYSIGKLGVCITKDSINNPSSYLLEAVPQIIYNNAPISDTVNWVKIEGNFESVGGEQFLTIGYFFDDLTNDTTFIQSFPEIIDCAAYYYIDSVELKLIHPIFNCEIIIPNVYTPNNDGINDVWGFSSNVEGELHILDRWGNILFNQKGTKFQWECANCTDGVYYYKFGTSQNIKTGFIQLIR